MSCYKFVSTKNNHYRSFGIILALLLSSASQGFAQGTTILPEVLVTGSRFGVDAQKVGNAHTVITGKELANAGHIYAADALRKIPGIALNRSGNSGGLTQVRLRGAEGNHVLVLIDGIEVSNPVQGEYNFTGLLVENIERIEVLRGPQSALWGSNATAGVINIITKKAQQGISIISTIEAGSFATVKASTGLFIGDDRVRIALNAGALNTKGTNVSSFGSERDGDRNLTLSFKGDVDITKMLNLDGVLRYVARRNELDPQDFIYPATPTNGLVVDGDRASKSGELFGKTTATFRFLEGNWVHKISAALTDTKLDSFADGPKTSGTEGRREVFSSLNLLKFETPAIAGAHHTFTSLIERKYESFRNTAPTATPDQAKRQHRTLYGFAGEYRVDLWDQLFLSGALRYDKNDKFKNTHTFRTTAAYLLSSSDTRFHGSIGTGVTNPSFFEQFGFSPSRFDGNPGLKPEKSLGWDIGVEQNFFNKKLSIDVTYFQADLKDEIISTFDSVTFRSSVANLSGKSQRRGVEVSLKAQPVSNLDLGINYTYTHSTDATGAKEVRRPMHIASFDATLRFLQDRAKLNLSIAYNGKNEDLEFVASTPRTRVTLDDYALVNLAGTYQISDNVQWYGRVENLLDQQYQEIFSFNSPGITAYSGFKFNL